MVGMPPNAIKVFAVLASNGWPLGLNTNQVAVLCGLHWQTVATALDTLRAGGWLDADNQPVKGATPRSAEEAVTGES